MPKRKPKFGLWLPHVLPKVFTGPWEAQADPTVLVTVAQRAESLGYSFVTVADHIAVPQQNLGRLGALFPDPFVTLAYIASATHRIRLLTSVGVVPYRSPLATAKAVATLDFLSGGRFIFGVGVGYLEGEFAALGVPFQKRGAMGTEYLLAMKELWSRDVASFQGSYCRFTEVALSPKPVQKPHPPIWVGGRSRAALRRAAEVGDGWMPQRSAVGPRELKECLDFMRGLPQFSPKAATFETIAGYWPLQGRAPRRGTPPAPARSPKELSTEEVLEQVAQWVDAGATQVQVGFQVESQQEFLENVQWFAEEVMPQA